MDYRSLPKECSSLHIGDTVCIEKLTNITGVYFLVKDLYLEPTGDGITAYTMGTLVYMNTYRDNSYKDVLASGKDVTVVYNRGGISIGLFGIL